MDIKQLDIKLLKPYKNNPRKNDAAAVAVAESIKTFGFRQPLVVDSDMVVIVGHTRLMAAELLGMDTVPVHIAAGLTEQQAKAYRLADNKTSELAEWDRQLLTTEIAELVGSGFEMESTGFSELETMELMGLSDYAGFGDAVAGQDSGMPFNIDRIADAAFAYFRETGFPYRDKPIHVAMQEINKLAAADPATLKKTTIAYHVADNWNRHRFEAAGNGMKSPVQVFNNDKALKKNIAKALEMGDTIGKQYPSKLDITNGCQPCWNFRPGFAMGIYRSFCPDGGTVLDTSTGYGGRIVGAIASGVVGKYIGTDPNKPTYEANRAMVKALAPGMDFELLNLPAEDIEAETLRDSCDFAFTSPPYFSKEIYSEDATQSHKRYKGQENWKNGFLLKMLELQFVALKPGAVNAVNIADVNIGNERVPLEDWTQELALQAGFIQEDTLKFRLSKSNDFRSKDGRRDFEPVFIFRKPGGDKQ